MVQQTGAVRDCFESIKNIKDFLESQQKTIEDMKWISVNDRLPNDYQRVLVVNKGNAMKIVTYRDKYKGAKYWGDSMVDLFASPTHWMLPKTPLKQ